MLTEPQKLAKTALDTVIQKSRVHLYKPTQIAEILFHHRTEKGWDLNDVESYRNTSKKWRNEISKSLVGRVSTSSQKYQDNIFEDNAMPPKFLAELGTVNKKGNGLIEAYIYQALEARLSSVCAVYEYVSMATADSFSLNKLMVFFQAAPGLRRSVDKIYEILVYALFATIVRSLKVQVTLEIENKNEKILHDFKKFIKLVLGLNAQETRLTFPATLYRAGVTNAADRGIDMWANFGPAIQVKHLTLNAEHAEDIVNNVTADKVVIVCCDTERKSIEGILQQIGFGEKIQGIITFTDLVEWYQLCLHEKYRNNLGKNLLADVKREIAAEFPLNDKIASFFKERGYNQVVIPQDWKHRTHTSP